MKIEELRSRGDLELGERLREHRLIVKAMESMKEDVKRTGARRQLLATSLRLSSSMAPELYATVERCRELLGMTDPLEVYVYPSASFNAAAVHPEEGRFFMLLSSALLEGFDEQELEFVIGHELAHHLLDHHSIPAGQLLAGHQSMSPELLLTLFAWQRYAEISCDRAGLVCAGGLEPTTRALFKLASGLRGGSVKVDLEAFLKQMRDLRSEAERLASADGPARSDWFATHPFSPLRLSAAELFSRSAQVVDGGLSLDELELQVHDLMGVMEPSYLQERTEEAEAMRRLLFAGGIAIATAGHAELDRTSLEKKLEAVEELLGEGAVPSELKPDLIKADLPKRAETVRTKVAALRRVQVIRDLCVIARADGTVHLEETAIIDEIARMVDVEPELVSCPVALPNPMEDSRLGM